MKHIYCFICVLFFSVNVHAQLMTVNQINQSFGFGGSTGGLIDLEPLNTGTSGTTYYSEKWLVGKIKATDSHLFENLQYRYNIKNHSLVIKLEEDKIKVVPNRYIKKFQFVDAEGMNHQFKNAKGYSVNGVPIVGFVESLHQGDFELIYRYSIRIKPADNRPYGLSPTTPEYTTKIQVFAAKGNKELTPIKSKKDLLPFFGEKSSEMKRYFHKNVIKLKKFNTVKTMLDYYNSL